MQPKTALDNHFKELLLPRSHGIIGVTPLRAEASTTINVAAQAPPSEAECPPLRTRTKRRRITQRAHLRSMATGVVTSLGQANPFFELNLEDGVVVLRAGYPRGIARWEVVEWGDSKWVPDDNQFRQIYPFSKKPKEKADQLAALSVLRVDKHNSISIDLAEPDSLPKAEFIANFVITTIKYMVTRSGYSGHKPKEGIEFTNLIELATEDYHRRVVVPQRQKVS